MRIINWRLLVLWSAVIGLMAMAAGAVTVDSFDRAKTVSAQQGKPILLEFVHED